MEEIRGVKKEEGTSFAELVNLLESESIKFSDYLGRTYKDWRSFSGLTKSLLDGSIVTETRAKNLLKTKLVDDVILLPTLKSAEDYLQMVQTIKPNIIAVTAGDPQMENKKKQAKKTGAKVKIVIDRLPGLSTTNLINKKVVIPAKAGIQNGS